MSINVAAPAYRSEAEARKARHYPRLRATRTCPLCRGNKNSGLVACWPCFTAAFDTTDDAALVAEHALSDAEAALGPMGAPALPIADFRALLIRAEGSGVFTNRYGDTRAAQKNEGQYDLLYWLASASDYHRALFDAFSFYSPRSDVLSHPPADPVALAAWKREAGYPAVAS